MKLKNKKKVLDIFKPDQEEKKMCTVTVRRMNDGKEITKEIPVDQIDELAKDPAKFLSEEKLSPITEEEKEYEPQKRPGRFNNKILTEVKESMRRGNCPIYYYDNQVINQETPYDVVCDDLQTLRDGMTKDLKGKEPTATQKTVLNHLQTANIDTIVDKYSNQIVQTSLSYIHEAINNAIKEYGEVNVQCILYTRNIMYNIEQSFSANCCGFYSSVNRELRTVVMLYCKDDVISRRDNRELDYHSIDFQMKVATENIMNEISNKYSQSLNEFAYCQYQINSNTIETGGTDTSEILSYLMYKGKDIMSNLFILIYGNIAAMGNSLIDSWIQREPFDQNIYGPYREDKDFVDDDDKWCNGPVFF